MFHDGPFRKTSQICLLVSAVDLDKRLMFMSQRFCEIVANVLPANIHEIFTSRYWVNHGLKIAHSLLSCSIMVELKNVDRDASESGIIPEV